MIKNKLLGDGVVRCLRGPFLQRRHLFPDGNHHGIKGEEKGSKKYRTVASDHYPGTRYSSRAPIPCPSLYSFSRTWLGGELSGKTPTSTNASHTAGGLTTK